MTSASRPRRIRTRVVIAILVGTPLVLLLAWSIVQRATAPRRPTIVVPPRHAPRLAVEPAEFDLGRRSQCDGLVTARGVLRNTSDQPAVLDEWILACGCTAPQGALERGMTIAPGESVEFEIASDSWMTPGLKNFTIDFIERGATGPVRMTIRYIVESPLHTNVGHITRATTGSTEFLVRTRDDQPFRVLSVDPPIVDFDAELTALEHPMRIDWPAVAAELEGMEGDTSLRITTDRPDCPDLFVRLRAG